MPSVDGGILVIARRPEPLLALPERRAYQRLVGAVFTGRGAGLAAILHRHLPAPVVAQWLQSRRLAPGALPGRLSAADWVSLYLRWTAG